MKLKRDGVRREAEPRQSALGQEHFVSVTVILCESLTKNDCDIGCHWLPLTCVSVLPPVHVQAG